MLATRRLPLWSLRGRLSAMALAGLTTTVLLTVLLLLTAWSATEVVATARLTHDRVRVFSQLQDAARDYQGASYQRVREPGAESRRQAANARNRLENLLAEASRLKVLNDQDRAAGERIARQGAVVLAHFDRADDLVKKVDSIWREQGSRAAMREVDRLTQPIYAFKFTLNGEIRRGDWTVATATRDAQSLIRTAVYGSLAGLALALAFSLAVQYLLQARLRPALKRLEAGARAFGEGDLEHRVGLDGRDELARLSGAFDSMAATIAEKQDALRRIREELELSVSERTEELQHANAKLAAADERRRAFLADVSHELRTPLTIIRGEAQVALRAADRADFCPHEPLERILQQTHDLGRMVDDLLLIAQAEVGKLPLEREVLDLRKLGEGLAADFDTLANEMSGSISSVPGPAVFASVDRTRLRRALAALIENSLRHSQNGVGIVIEARGTDREAEIAVSDDGPGLDFDRAECLFERFRRGEARGEGSGLGLSLVHALARAHGGRIALLPREGGGTVAILRFPRAIPEQEAA